MERVTLVLVLICASSHASPFTTKQFRSDYVYNRKTDAFYKLHIESNRAWIARDKCITEGAKLMVPASQQDIMQAHALFKKFPDLGNYVLVDSDNQPHESVEEEQIFGAPIRSDTMNVCDVVTRNGEVEEFPCYQSAPFICKVDAKDAPYDEHCDVYGLNYINKISTTGSCYKIPSIVYSWNEAEAECRAEGSHLVILNSEGEHDVVWDILKQAQSQNGAITSWFFFAGIRANHPTDGTPRVFRTVMNQTLEEAGYTQWSTNEPNNYQDSEYCGSLFKNDGKYNDLACSHTYAFVCEKEKELFNE